MDNAEPIRSSPKLNKKAIGIKYGIFTSAAMIGYFLLMAMFNLVAVVELRMLNYVFIGLGIWLALWEVEKKEPGHLVRYLPGMGVGFWVSGIAAIIFAIFIMLYGTINKSFVPEIRQSMPYSPYLPPSLVAFETLSETIIVSIIINLIVLFIRPGQVKD